MTTAMRYTILWLVLGFLALSNQAQAQCTANAIATNALCFGSADGSIDLTAENGTGPYTYLWSNSQTTEDIGNLSAATYTCTVTDMLGCITTAQATVTHPTELNVVILNQTLTCVTPVTEVEAIVSGGTPPYSYTWSNGITTSEFFVEIPGFYSLTVTDLNNCTKVANVAINQDVVPPVACTAPSPVLTCSNPMALLDANCSSMGPDFQFQWSSPNGNIVNGGNSPVPLVDAPGIYFLTVTNVTNGCTSMIAIDVVADQVMPTIAGAGPDLELPCGGGILTLVGNGPGGANFTFAWTTTDGNILSGGNTLNPLVNEPGTYTLLVVNVFNGCTATDAMQVLPGGTGLCGTIEGQLWNDTTLNCLTDAGEPALSGWIVRAESAQGTFFGVTDANGQYQIQVEAGETYSITAILPSLAWAACPPIPDVPVLNVGQTYFADDLLLQKLFNCPLLRVDIASGNLRRCFNTNFFSVSYCNDGTNMAEDAFVLVTLDALVTPVSASIAYTDLGSGVYRFDVGDLETGECGSFHFNAHIDCSAANGQTICAEAHIFPDSSCLPTNAQWSGASLKISSQCAPDSVHFQIKNVGVGDMPNALEYIVIEDQIMLMSAPIQLNAGESVIVSAPANGSTWRLEMEQEPFHPGLSAPAISVEGCTTGGIFSTGFVNQFSPDDADAFIDISCREITGSYDPNDKQGFPKGYGTQHYIRPGTPLEYLIRFQNTGNDTAFTVRLADTLSAWLDPATFRPGASSHPYTWDLSGAGVLSFLYENILLPDSNVNEPASHGFVKFNIQHRSDAPLETVIENTAHIYFDFNEAVVTNTTSHRLGENFVTVGLWQPQQAQYRILVSPNPMVDQAVLEVKGLANPSGLQLQVFDLQGKLQMEASSAGPVFSIQRGTLPEGIYLFNIIQDGQILGTGKLLIQG